MDGLKQNVSIELTWMWAKITEDGTHYFPCVLIRYILHINLGLDKILEEKFEVSYRNPQFSP